MRPSSGPAPILALFFGVQRLHSFDMKLIVGHGNMDLDCIGSIVLARYLFPDHVPVRSHLVHPVAKKLLNLYENKLNLLCASDLKGKPVERIVVVDTSSMDRIAEYLRDAGDSANVEYEVFDHHPAVGSDIPAIRTHSASVGANTSQLALEIARRGMKIDSSDATIALTGIYADTGNFTHSNVTRADFDAAAFLLTQGASLALVKDFLVPLREKFQIVLFHEILNQIEKRDLRGHRLLTCYMELEEDSQGLGAVVEQAFEVEGGELLLGFFNFYKKGKMLAIGRSSNPRFCLDEVMRAFGGGGHGQAAAATVKTVDGKATMNQLLEYLEALLTPAATAADIMSDEVDALSPELSVMEAALFLERVSHTGAPVCDSEGKVVGFMTLRDIQKARKAGQMHVPVATFMSKNLIWASPSATVSEIDDLMFEKSVGHLPIIDGGRLLGLVSRGDILDFKQDERRRKASILEAVPVVA